MKVFITGGAGYLGVPLTEALVAEDHEVTGLSRNDTATQRLKSLGAQTFAGDLLDPEPIIREAAQCDAFIHLAQDRGPQRYETDARLIKGLAGLPDGKSRLRHLIYTSTLFVLGNVKGEPASETALTDPPEWVAPRADVERQVLSAASSDLVTSVIRPGMVYGGGAGGSVSELFRSAWEDGAAQYVGNGENRWTMIHRADAAALYVAAIREGAGGVLHAVDGEPIRVRDVARLAARAAGKGESTSALDVDDSREFLGAFADALVLDQPAVSVRAMQLGWTPKWPSFHTSAPAAFLEWQQSRAE